jgi:tetratricopeptide (TPR) repeat protein
VDPSASSRTLGRWFFDARTLTLYPVQLPDCPLALGAGYVWRLDGSLKRIELSRLRPLASPWSESARQEVPWSQDTTRDAIMAQANSWLTWDGQGLWSLHATPLEGSKYANQMSLPGSGRVAQDKPTVLLPPVHLIRIDAGLTRKPDSAERHQKTLAFEKANGTQKAIPLFEKIASDDLAAVEVRNHLAWAFATRPHEPYHDILLAKQLAEGAAAWEPWNPEIWDTLAEIWWRLGHAELAAHLEAKAINLNPNKTFYWRQLDKFQSGPAAPDAPEPAY